MRTDSPICKKEDDILERYMFAEEIVKNLLETFSTGQDSIAIGLNGEWGSGKSSILEFISTEIRNQTQHEERLNIIFRFNPWLFSGQADLQKSFLTQLGIHLRTINPELKKLGKDIALISAITEFANLFNPEIISRSFIKGGTKIVKKIAKQISNEPSLQILKERIDEALESSSIKVFVIIDDIDRLIPNEIANIFRLVNLNANFKNTFFFLAYDKAVVSQSLSAEFKVSGEQFLEKIIQLDYTIPKLTPELLERLFMDNFTKLALLSHEQESSRKELGRLWENGLSEYFTNLRHIYRYFNALELRYPAIKEEVDIIDFGAIEAIRLFDYSAYEWIYQNRESLVSKVEPLAPPGIDFEKRPSILELVESVKHIVIRTNTRNVINSIFNSIHFPEINFGKTKIDMVKLEREKRIAHKDYFDQYFSFKISNSLIPEKTIHNFLNSDIENRERLLDEYLDHKLSLFLKRLFYSFPYSHYAGISKFMLDYSDKRKLHLLKGDQFGQDALYIVISFLNNVCDKFGFNEYFEEILASHQSFSRFYLQGYLRNRVLGNNNIEPVRYFPEQLISGEEERIRNTYNQSLKYFAAEYLTTPSNDNLEIINNLFRLLYDEEKELYQEKIDEYLGKVETTLILLRCSLTPLWTFGEVYYSLLNEKFMLPELTIEKLDAVLSKVKMEDYDGENKKYLALFFSLKDSGFAQNYHLTIDLKPIEL